MIINYFTSTWTVTLLGSCIRLDAWITFNFDYRWCIWYLCFYVLITYSVLWCVVYVILRCGKLSVCLSVCLSICPCLCEHVSSPITSVLYEMIRNTYCLWLPNFQGHMANFKVTQAKKTVKRVKLMVFGHFLENAWGKGLKYHMLLYPDHLIRFWLRSVDFTNFDGILNQWNISNVWFPYLMENTCQ